MYFLCEDDFGNIMNKYEPYEQYAIRKPLFSYSILFNNENATRNLEELVTEMLDNDEFVTSIYWSSPDLHETILSYKSNTLKSEKIHKLFNTLKKYVIRASTRCTPYGTFAGTVTRSVKESENATTKLLRSATVDIDFLRQLINHIESNEALKQTLKYKVNNTVFTLGDQLRFQEPAKDGKFQLSSLHITEYITLLSELKNPVSYSEITKLFSLDIDSEEIVIFLDQLIGMKFLVSELQLTINENNLENTVLTLSKLDFCETQKYLYILSKIQECISILEDTPVNFLPKTKIEEVRNLAKEFGIYNSHVFNVDLIQSSESDFFLSKKLLNNINSSITLLNHFAPKNQTKIDLENFKKIFTIKYDLQEIPLVEVLDPEFGIEYPANSHIGDLHTNGLISGINKQKVVDGQIGTSISSDLLDIIEKTVEKEIKLEDHNLKNVLSECIRSQNFYIVGSPNEDNFFLQTVGTSSANSILGRFAYGNKKIKLICDELRKDEKYHNSEVIYAEVIFIPEKRTGNIVIRPSFSDYEIPIFTESQKDNLQQITIEDILVSIKNGEIVLRSKKLNKRIIPKISNAYNFHNSENSSYKFLASIQSQNEDNLNFNVDYGKIKKRFLPRIVYKNIILHRATWILHENDIEQISNSKDSLLKLKMFIGKWEIPQFVVLVQSDNELFLDTSKDDYLILLIEEFKKNKLIQLSEWLRSGIDKVQCSQQIILPLKNNNYARINKLDENVISTAQRSFAPGSEWLYMKIYCNSNIAEILLTNEIKPLVDMLLRDKLVKSIFFIRYTDPHYHLRIRFNLSNLKNFAAVLKEVYKILNPYFLKGIIWNLQLDSYNRELERYHTDDIIATERVFHYDSLLVLNLLMSEELSNKEHIRLFKAVKNVDYWLSLHNLSTLEKLEYSKQLGNQLSDEFSQDLKTQINVKYRELKEELYLFMKSEIYNNEFKLRNRKLNNLKLSKSNLSSHIHMSLNRLFSSEHRALELMTYSFAVKYYGKILHHQN